MRPPGLRSITAASALLATILLGAILWYVARLPLVTERQTLLDLQHQASLVREAWLREFDSAMAGPGAHAHSGNELWRAFERYARDWELRRPLPPDPDLEIDETLRPARENLLDGHPDTLAVLEFRESPSLSKHQSLIESGEMLQPQLERVAEQTLSGLTVVDHHGDVVASSVPAWRERQITAGDDPQHEPGIEEIEAALRDGVPQARRRHRRIADTDDGPLARSAAWQISVAVPVVKAGRVLGAVHVVRTPPTILEVLRADIGVRGLFLLGFGLLLVPLSALGTLQFFAITPLRDLAARARAAAGGNQPELLTSPSPRSREIEELSRSLAEMTRNLRDHVGDEAVRADDFAHSIKNKFVTILASVDALRNSWEQLSPEERAASFERIRTASDQARQMAVDTLAFAHALKPGAPDATSLLADVLEDAAEASAALDIRLPERATLDCWIAVDERSLTSVFERLCENAEQHGARSARIRVRREGGSMLVDFADDGRGVGLAEPEQIFDRGFTANHQGGTGLGLAIVRRLLERYGGAIEYRGDSIGAHFRLRLPISRHEPIRLAPDDETGHAP